MLNRKKIFFLVLLGALTLHAGGLLLLHKLPLKIASFAIKKIGSDSLIGESAREEWMMDLVESARADQIEIKEELSDLTEEFAPEPSLSFPLSDSLEEKTELLPAFPHTLPDFPDNAYDGLSFLDGSAPAREGFSSFYEAGEPSDALSLTFPYLETDPSGTLAESEHFDVNVEFLPRRLHPGYLFKVTLIPKQQIAFKRIRENYFFLIDRSNSIIRGRYFYNKKAVSDGLAFLKPGDCFNILIFDGHVTRFSAEPVIWNEENVEKARSFLAEERHGGFFAATDIYTSLGKIVPENVSRDEINTAILLSDGDTYLGVESQRQLIGGWSARNAGKVTLFSFASGGGNNLTLLELLSNFNKGELIYVSKHDQVGERLKQLLLSLQNPIGKGITATAISPADETAIYLEPKNARLPDLYKNRPFTLFGCTNQLSDFTLFLQGTYYDRTFDIKKRISFQDARLGTLFLEREWTKLVAAEYYERFFQDGKMAHLEAANELLRPLNITAPFTQ